MADAVATTVGAVLGTTTTTTFVESASGVSEGGRTGLTSATTAIFIRVVVVPVTNLPCNSIVCNSTGFDRSGILHVDKCDTH